MTYTTPKPAVWLPAVKTKTGTDTFTKQLADGLAKRGIRVEITWLPLRAEYAPWTVPAPSPPEWATVAHVNTWLHQCFLPLRLPIVATIHHSIHHPDVRIYKGLARTLYHNLWIAPNEKCTMRRADRIVAVSNFVASTASQTLLDVPMDVIYNGVDVGSFQLGRGQPRQPSKPFRLLYVGNWKKLKGVDLLDPIMRELGDKFELRYTGGHGKLRRHASVPRNMHDIGHLNDKNSVIAEMQRADAFIFPSRTEGFGLVAIEAMACGLPVIASRNSALEEIIKSGATGILCPVNDVMAFASAAKQLASNNNMYQNMSRHAIKRVSMLFSFDSMLDKYISVYQNIINQKQTAC